LPKSEEARVPGKQFLRSGTSVGANYRAACRGRSAADFVSKVSTVTEEADETLFWPELVLEAKLVEAKHVDHFLKRAKN
jgi:four helix bundle protein